MITYPIGTILHHRNRGRCVFTETCARLQSLNPDPSSIFVEIDGDVQEVTAALVSCEYRTLALTEEGAS